MKANTMPKGVYTKLKSRLNLTFLMGALLLVSCAGDEDDSQLTADELPLANCYMVVPGGKVSIPITWAITIGEMSPSVTAMVETLWDDAGVISGSPTLSGSGDTRTITVQTSSRQGNAVIALQSDGLIYWSWHIWVVNYDPNTGGTWTNNGFTFMDRNLGATEAALSLASWGLLYQWGRKDPFPGGKEGTAGYAALSRFKGMSDAGSKDRVDLNEITVYGGILESIRNPTTFYTSRSSYDWLPQPDDKLWNTTNDAKTVYDPCPAGWRVPLARADDENASPWHGIRWKKTDTPTDDWGYITSDGWVILNTKHRDQYGDPTTGAYYWCGDRSSKGWLYTPYRGYGEITHYSKALGNTVRCIKE